MKTMFLGAALICGATTLSCGEMSPTSEDQGVEVVQAPLLGIPGAFYTAAPAFGFCGVSAQTECHGGYSFNSMGANPTLLNRGVGMYRVTFENLPTNGNAQVVSASGDTHCNVSAQFPSGTGVGIDVFCRAPSGAQADTKFMLSYYRDTNVGGSLGGYANVVGVAPFTTSNAWNSTGAPISVIGLGIGSYRVSFAGQGAGGDNAQVTALTSGAAYCTLGANGWGGGTVDVRCFNSSGAPANVNFSLSYGHNVRGEPRNNLPAGTQGALVLVGPQGGVDATRSRNNCQAGGNSATLLPPGPGLGANGYQEIYHAITTTPAEVPLMSLVSALSNAGVYCNLSHFPIQGVKSDSKGYVNCFTPNGTSATAMHSSMFIIQDHGGC